MGPERPAAELVQNYSKIIQLRVRYEDSEDFHLLGGRPPR